MLINLFLVCGTIDFSSLKYEWSYQCKLDPETTKAPIN